MDEKKPVYYVYRLVSCDFEENDWQEVSGYDDIQSAIDMREALEKKGWTAEIHVSTEG